MTETAVRPSDTAVLDRLCETPLRPLDSVLALTLCISMTMLAGLLTDYSVRLLVETGIRVNKCVL